MLVDRITLPEQHMTEIAFAPHREGNEANNSINHLEDPLLIKYCLRQDYHMRPTSVNCKRLLKYLTVMGSCPHNSRSSAVASGDRASVVRGKHLATERPSTQRICCNGIASYPVQSIQNSCQASDCTHSGRSDVQGYILESRAIAQTNHNLHSMTEPIST